MIIFLNVVYGLLFFFGGFVSGRGRKILKREKKRKALLGQISS
jgi:hypothetical protein